VNEIEYKAMLNNKELMVHIDDYISYLENVYDKGGVLEIKYRSEGAIRRETFDLGFDKDRVLKCFSRFEFCYISLLGSLQARGNPLAHTSRWRASSVATTLS